MCVLCDLNNDRREPRFWKKHRDDVPFCNCRVCYWGRREPRKQMVNQYSNVPDVAYQAMYAIPEQPRVMPKPLEVRVAEDIAKLDWESLPVGDDIAHKDGIELPEPILSDLSSYKDAYEHAVRTCPHNRIEADNPFVPTLINCNDCDKQGMTYEQFMRDRNRHMANYVKPRRQHTENPAEFPGFD